MNSNLNSSSNNVNSLMMKSISSNSGELESSMSLSSSLALAALQLKRTYLYALISAKAKTITFYCFTTENTTHDSIKQLLDQSCETILQRYHLANNTVLYKFGGLIGDSLIYDLKKVKSLTLSATQTEINENRDLSNESIYDQKNKSNVAHLTASTPNSILNAKKLSSSPKHLHRHSSYKGSIDHSTHSINPSLIHNLQFSGTSSSSSSGSYQSSSLLPAPNTLSTILAFKQIYMISSSCKPYDNIINIVNQQISFCAQYLTGNTNATTLIDLNSSPSLLTGSSTLLNTYNTINR